ncbi:MAG: S-adenosylmethionine decarboxylase [Kofleriaceae bacterium]
MHGGTEWIVDARGCAPAQLRDPAALTSLCDGVVAALGLTVIGAPQVHHFGGPGGVTALYLLAESHLACHTFPETGIATFNLYVCRPRPAPAWAALLTAALGAATVDVTTLARGGAA